jgi:hypothetical protein
MTWRALTVLILVCSATRAAAQPVTSYTLKISNQGAALPLSVTVLPAGSFLCNQPAPTGTSTVNPTRVAFDDVTNVGQICVYTDSGAGPLLALPIGSGVYVATLAATNSTGTSGDSAASPSFTRPGVGAAVPTGVRVYR